MMNRFRRILKRHQYDDQETRLVPTGKKKSRVRKRLHKGRKRGKVRRGRKLRKRVRRQKKRPRKLYK